MKKFLADDFQKAELLSMSPNKVKKASVEKLIFSIDNNQLLYYYNLVTLKMIYSTFHKSGKSKRGSLFFMVSERCLSAKLK